MDYSDWVNPGLTGVPLLRGTITPHLAGTLRGDAHRDSHDLGNGLYATENHSLARHYADDRAAEWWGEYHQRQAALVFEVRPIPRGRLVLDFYRGPGRQAWDAHLNDLLALSPGLPDPRTGRTVNGYWLLLRGLLATHKVPLHEVAAIRAPEYLRVGDRGPRPQMVLRDSQLVREAVEAMRVRGPLEHRPAPDARWLPGAPARSLGITDVRVPGRSSSVLFRGAAAAGAAWSAYGAARDARERGSSDAMVVAHAVIGALGSALPAGRAESLLSLVSGAGSRSAVARAISDALPTEVATQFAHSAVDVFAAVSRNDRREALERYARQMLEGRYGEVARGWALVVAAAREASGGGPVPSELLRVPWLEELTGAVAVNSRPASSPATRPTSEQQSRRPWGRALSGAALGAGTGALMGGAVSALTPLGPAAAATGAAAGVVGGALSGYATQRSAATSVRRGPHFRSGGSRRRQGAPRPRTGVAVGDPAHAPDTGPSRRLRADMEAAVLDHRERDRAGRAAARDAQMASADERARERELRQLERQQTAWRDAEEGRRRRAAEVEARRQERERSHQAGGLGGSEAEQDAAQEARDLEVLRRDTEQRQRQNDDLRSLRDAHERAEHERQTREQERQQRALERAQLERERVERERERQQRETEHLARENDRLHALRDQQVGAASAAHKTFDPQWDHQWKDLDHRPPEWASSLTDDLRRGRSAGSSPEQQARDQAHRWAADEAAGRNRPSNNGL